MVSRPLLEWGEPVRVNTKSCKSYKRHDVNIDYINKLYRIIDYISTKYMLFADVTYTITPDLRARQDHWRQNNGSKTDLCTNESLL